MVPSIIFLFITLILHEYLIVSPIGLQSLPGRGITDFQRILIRHNIVDHDSMGDGPVRQKRGVRGTAYDAGGIHIPEKIPCSERLIMTSVE